MNEFLKIPICFIHEKCFIWLIDEYMYYLFWSKTKYRLPLTLFLVVCYLYGCCREILSPLCTSNIVFTMHFKVKGFWCVCNSMDASTISGLWLYTSDRTMWQRLRWKLNNFLFSLSNLNAFPYPYLELICLRELYNVV